MPPAGTPPGEARRLVGAGGLSPPAVAAGVKDALGRLKPNAVAGPLERLEDRLPAAAAAAAHGCVVCDAAASADYLAAAAAADATGHALTAGAAAFANAPAAATATEVVSPADAAVAAAASWEGWHARTDHAEDHGLGRAAAHFAPAGPGCSPLAAAAADAAATAVAGPPAAVRVARVLYWWAEPPAAAAVGLAGGGHRMVIHAVVLHAGGPAPSPAGHHRTVLCTRPAAQLQPLRLCWHQTPAADTEPMPSSCSHGWTNAAWTDGPGQQSSTMKE